MKKAISLLLCFSLLWMAYCPCASAESATLSVPEFSSLGDPALLPYMEDTLYEGLVSTLNSDEYFVENVSAVYISQEYLDELAYNSQANIYFGYTLAELNEQFQGTRYIFTLGENNETVVVPFEDYDDTFERVIQNVAVGTGVILVCVTVSVVAGGVGASAAAVNMIFACAAKTGAECAVSGAVMGAVSAGVVTGIQTGDMDAALKSAALAGSEGFKWGAITGAISGGTAEAMGLKFATGNGLSMNEAAAIQKESKYPLDIIKCIHSMKEYEIYKEAHLIPIRINNRTILTQGIDWSAVNDGRTNAQFVADGLAPIGPDGFPYEVHHVGQVDDGPLAILTRTEHRLGENNGALHYKDGPSCVDHGSSFAELKRLIWKGIKGSQGAQ